MNKLLNTLYSSVDFNRQSRRYDAQERHHITTFFLLSGLYCLVAIFFLLLFGVQSLFTGNISYALLLFAFAIVTSAGFFLIWYLGLYTWSGHLVVILMGSLCLVLYYTGGEELTGPMWYLVFPILAMFVQGRVAGILSVIILLAATYMLSDVRIGDSEAARYSDVFLLRLISIYLAISILSYLFALFRYQAETQLKTSNKQLEIMTNTDKLSGLLNRRGMEEALQQQEQTYKRFDMPFSLIMFDLDNFKQINDQNGHVFGDFVLQGVAEICRDSIRTIDYASRWGGEEFMLLLPGTTITGAEVLAERLREKISKHSFTLEGVNVSVTASFGLCQHAGSDGTEKTIQMADACMYAAKQQGKNRVVSKIETDST